MYNPSLHTASNKPIGLTGKPVDARSYFYDAVNFIYRPYLNGAEVLSYLLDEARYGQFVVIINTDGTLNGDGTITGGTNNEWWFKDGITDDELVLKPVAGLTAGGTTGQVLSKIDNVNFNTEWVDKFAGLQASDIALALGYIAADDDDVVPYTGAIANLNTPFDVIAKTIRSEGMRVFGDFASHGRGDIVGNDGAGNTYGINWTGHSLSFGDYASFNWGLIYSGGMRVYANDGDSNGVVRNSDLSLYIPYTGATTDVNLGTNSLFINTPNTFNSSRYIYFMGDSYIYGSGASITAKRYSSIVANELGYIEQNNGIAGSLLEKRVPIDTNNFVDRASSIPTYGANSGYLVIAGGLNDVFNNGVNYTTTNYITDYTTIINTAIAKSWPVNKIVLVAPYYVLIYTPVGGNPVADATRHQAFVAATASLASSFGTLYFDAYNYTYNNGGVLLIGPDNTHPNDDGYRILAKGLIDTIGYSVTTDAQKIATNGIVEFSDIVYRNTNTNSAYQELGLDAYGHIVIDKTGHIRNIQDSSTQAANLSINGYGNIAGSLTSGNITGSGYAILNNYLQLKTGSTYPASRLGLLAIANPGNNLIDSYDITTPGAVSPLVINKNSTSNIEFWGNTTIANGKILTGTGAIIGNSYGQFFGIGYPSSRTGFIIAGQGANTYIDAYSSTSAGTAVPMWLQNQSGGDIVFYGATSVNGSKTFTTGTGKVTIGGAIDMTATGGLGYILSTSQGSTTPTTPSANTFKAYSDISNRPSWIYPDGFTRKFDFTANAANTVYTFPTATSTLASLSGVETFQNKTLISPIFNTTSAVGQIWTAINTTGAGAWTTRLAISESSASAFQIGLTNTQTSGQAMAGNQYLVYNGSSVAYNGGIFATGNSWSFNDYLANSLNMEGAAVNGLNFTASNAAGIIKFNTGGGLLANRRMTILANGHTLLGTTTDVTPSLLTVASTTLGTIPMPIMTTTQQNAISSPVEGLQIFDNVLHRPAYYNGTSWVSAFVNPMTTSGDIIYGGSGGAPTRLAGNTTTARQFLTSTGSGSAATAPAYFDLFGTANTWSADNTFNSKIIAGNIIRLKSYTVATLPAGTLNDTAAVTDAVAPTYLGVLTGGGSVYTPVVYNGSNWVAY